MAEHYMIEVCIGNNIPHYTLLNRVFVVVPNGRRLRRQKLIPFPNENKHLKAGLHNRMFLGIIDPCLLLALEIPMGVFMLR